MASASRRAGRVFSSSSAFGRRASETSIPPKGAYQLWIEASLIAGASTLR